MRITSGDTRIARSTTHYASSTPVEDSRTIKLHLRP